MAWRDNTTTLQGAFTLHLSPIQTYGLLFTYSRNNPSEHLLIFNEMREKEVIAFTCAHLELEPLLPLETTIYGWIKTKHYDANELKGLLRSLRKTLNKHTTPMIERKFEAIDTWVETVAHFERVMSSMVAVEKITFHVSAAERNRTHQLLGLPTKLWPTKLLKTQRQVTK